VSAQSWWRRRGPIPWAREIIQNEPRIQGWRRRATRNVLVGLAEYYFAQIAWRWPRPRDLSVAVRKHVVPVPDIPAIGVAIITSKKGRPPAISIVTPTYQHADFLPWTLRSVLFQGYPQLEYIVMDDGSTDGTADILERYAPYCAHVESGPNQGQAAVVRRGFEGATGDILGFLNSDDLLAPGALDFVGKFFVEHPEVDAVYSHRVIVAEDNTVTGHWIVPPHRDWWMRRWDYIPQETCFWRRGIYEKAGGIDPTFQLALDFDLFSRFMNCGGHFYRANRFLGAFRLHRLSKTSQMVASEVHPEVARVWRENGIVFHDWYRMAGVGIKELLDVKSRRFAASGRVLPGALSGIGYNYDAAWGGLLGDPRLPGAGPR
jgi:glycosyltransferase involved in cell wall biosynthesis